MWDGHWYYIIAMVGYPSELPITDSGHVGESAWAFMPAYPAVVRVLMLTGAPFGVAAVTVSILGALGAAFAVHWLLRLVLSERDCLFAVALFCVAPLSAILQVAYAESMHLALLLLALGLLLRRQYAVLVPVVVVMSLTRPSGLAFALAMAMHIAYRFVIRRRDAFPVAERWGALAVAAASGLAGFSWPAIAWAVTGSLTAYTDTELAWRAPYIGYQHLVPFTPWIQGANWWLGVPIGALALAVAVLLFALAFFTPGVRRLGPDLMFWTASYALYLLAVFFPQSSTFRLLIPFAPLVGALAQPRSMVYRVAMITAFIAGQWGWIHIAWFVDGRDWTPP